MFTGIVEETGTILGLHTTEGGMRLRLGGRVALGGIAIGSSIAVDGICLTVVAHGPGWFEVEATPETLRRTSLGDRQAGDGVHLERALAVGGHLGGHFVQGHVDAVGTIVDRRAEGDSVIATYHAPPEVGRYLVPKGSVAIDGVSLTVVTCDDRPDGTDFTIALIPHTLEVTLLGKRPLGSKVNLEADILAKYVERALAYVPPA